MLFDEFRANRAGQEYFLDGYRRIASLLIHNYVEIIFWLACTCTVFAADYEQKFALGVGTVSEGGGTHSSFIAMITFGDFRLRPQTTIAAMILMLYATVGVFKTLLSLARFIAPLPALRPKTAWVEGTFSDHPTSVYLESRLSLHR